MTQVILARMAPAILAKIAAMMWQFSSVAMRRFAVAGQFLFRSRGWASVIYIYIIFTYVYVYDIILLEKSAGIVIVKCLIEL